MHELVKLITHWTSFTGKHPEANVEDFCRYVLAQNSGEDVPAQPSNEKRLVPMDLDSRFMRAVTRTAMSLWNYMKIALKDTSVKTLENFTFLASLHVHGECRKSEIINYAMIEFSTGIEILNRMIKSGMIKERIDPQDKRGRLLSLTEEGKKNLYACFKRNSMAKEILLQDVSEEDKKVCVLVLEPIHTRHAALSMANRSKSIEEVYDTLVVNQVPKQ
jgi:DNA-binding MarR family transcriptional regulator